MLLFLFRCEVVARIAYKHNRVSAMRVVQALGCAYKSGLEINRHLQPNCTKSAMLDHMCAHFLFPTVARKKVVAAFDGGRMT